jgi:hypothetical protein
MAEISIGEFLDMIKSSHISAHGTVVLLQHLFMQCQILHTHTVEMANATLKSIFDPSDEAWMCKFRRAAMISKPPPAQHTPAIEEAEDANQTVDFGKEWGSPMTGASVDDGECAEPCTDMDTTATFPGVETDDAIESSGCSQPDDCIIMGVCVRRYEAREVVSYEHADSNEVEYYPRAWWETMIAHGFNAGLELYKTRRVYQINPSQINNIDLVESA